MQTSKTKFMVHLLFLNFKFQNFESNIPLLQSFSCLHFDIKLTVFRFISFSPIKRDIIFWQFFIYMYRFRAPFCSNFQNLPQFIVVFTEPMTGYNKAVSSLQNSHLCQIFYIILQNLLTRWKVQKCL